MLKYIIGLGLLLACVACYFIFPQPSVTLEEVQHQVNSTMVYKSDVKGQDNWDITCPKEGDCEDYALCKSRKLNGHGFKPKDMILLIGSTPTQDHAVLLVDGMILDNLREKTYPFDPKSKDFTPLYGCRLDGQQFYIYTDTGRLTFYSKDADRIPMREGSVQPILDDDHWMKVKCDKVKF